MKCMKWKNWHESIDMNDLKWRNWNAWVDTNELSWMNWNERIEMKELKWVNWNKWIDMTEELKRTNQKEWIEMKELTWRKWNGGTDMKELKWRNWSEGIEPNKSKWMNWNERIDVNEVRCRNWNEGIDINDLILKRTKNSFWRFLCDQLLDDDMVDGWNGALATVARALCRPHCRPHLQKVVRSCQFLRLLCEIELLLQSAMMVAVMVRQPAIDNCPQLGSFLTKLPLMINCMLWLCLIFHLSRARHSWRWSGYSRRRSRNRLASRPRRRLRRRPVSTFFFRGKNQSDLWSLWACFGVEIWRFPEIGVPPNHSF